MSASQEVQPGLGLGAEFGQMISTKITRLAFTLCGALADGGVDTRSGIFSCLAAVVFHPGISQNDLASLTNRDKSIIAGIVNDLENSGWIVRKRSEHDRRRHELYVTQSGQEMLTHLLGIVREVEARFFGEMSGPSIERLSELLDEARHSCSQAQSRYMEVHVHVPRRFAF